MTSPRSSNLTTNAQAIDPPSLERHFGGGEGLLPLWIAEPYLELAPDISAALTDRARIPWVGYETRPGSLVDGFWEWMAKRHRWNGSGLHTILSPSVGTSIGVLIDQMTKPGEGIILQPPVFTDFKPLITSAGRRVMRNALTLTEDGYVMDFEGLEVAAADSSTRAFILCNPHNPVGRVWTTDELARVSTICARHDVFVIADEIHADITLSPHVFTPFSAVVADSGVSWAALHGPIKTFGLAGVCDTLIVTDGDRVASGFGTRSSQLHLTRNNVFGLVAFEAAYRSGETWLDGLLELVASNRDLLTEHLPKGIKLRPLEGTYLAWLDCRELGMEVPELANWLGHSARLGLSPGHWFGREGAGFARLTVAAPTEQIFEAIERLTQAVHRLQ